MISINTSLAKTILEGGYKGDLVQIKTESYKLFPEIPVVKGNQWKGI